VRRTFTGKSLLAANLSAMNEQVTRADMHVHSSASELSKLGVQRSLALPECATNPMEVYEQAKARGMDFVTITDHDTIDGVLTIADRSDTFISEELTVAFKGEPQAVHVLCYGITPDDHEWLQSHNDDVEACAEYLRAHEITAALAHPFYAVQAPLTARHRRRLAELFPIWETRNGARAKELNLPAFVYIETHGGTAIGGSDDHAGIDIGRTFTETPPASTPQAFLDHVRSGRALARGDQGSAAKWTHAAIALAIRSLGGVSSDRALDPAVTLTMVQRLLTEGHARHGAAAADLGPEDARALLGAWLDALRLDIDGAELVRLLASGELSHAGLARRARVVHEQRLGDAVRSLGELLAGGSDVLATARRVFQASVPAIPYAAATAFLSGEKRRLSRAEGEPPRIALVADGLDAMHGVSAAVRQIRERGARGFEVEVIGTDSCVDRRLGAVASIGVPYYPGLQLGVPTLTGLVDALAEGRYDLVHICTPGPAGVMAGLVAHAQGLPLVASHHTELGAYAGLRSGRAELEALVAHGLRECYRRCELVLSPSPASDERLAELGIRPERIARWDRGVDLSRFSPVLRTPGLLPGAVNVLYAGRIAREKGVELLAEAFERARAVDPRLHLVVAGVGPEEGALRDRLGEQATFLGWLRGDELARVYASADAFVFPSRTDTFGQVVLEAQASGLPVVAVAEGGPLSLIDPGLSGLLVPPSAERLSGALLSLTAGPLLRERLRRGGLAAVRERSWEAALDRLAAGYRQALASAAARRAREIA
jgi:glycosyltransferase involved in cell wall biosynthesis/predicted metal-dependent phosphoesterase TrpH